MACHRIIIEDRLKAFLKKLYKKDRLRYEICMKKMEEIASNPEIYKPLRYEMKNIRRTHLLKSFVLIFRVEADAVRFLDLDHHDNIYRR